MLYTAPATGYAIVQYIITITTTPLANLNLGSNVIAPATTTTAASQPIYVGPSQTVSIVQTNAGGTFAVSLTGVEFTNTP